MKQFSINKIKVIFVFALIGASHICKAQVPIFTVNTGNDTTICVGQSIQLSASVSDGYPPYKYSWKPRAGLNDSTISNPIASPISSTEYILTVTNSIGVTATDSIMINVGPIPILFIRNPASVCTPATVDITAPAVTVRSIVTSLSYYTDPGATTLLPNPINVTTSGTYYIKATTPEACIDIEPVTVIINPVPSTPTITQTNDTLISNANIGNQWYQNGTLLPGENNQTFIATQNGDYSVLVTGPAGCISDSASVQVIIPVINSDSSVTYRTYPNPASNNIIITYTTTSTENVDITLYDFNGQQVMVVLKEQQVSPGNYSLTLSVAGLRPGTYFVHYALGNTIIIKEIIVI